MNIALGAGWLVDMGIALVLGSWFFDLYPAHPALAFAVGLVGVGYLTTFVDEAVFQASGIHIFENDSPPRP